uniref:Uncharacterized protein n=1 Tax=Romanomermis culicivorax TaxID=13658 RepID=A0A915JNU8_ROMCU
MILHTAQQKTIATSVSSTLAAAPCALNVSSAVAAVGVKIDFTGVKNSKTKILGENATAAKNVGVASTNRRSTSTADNASPFTGPSISTSYHSALSSNGRRNVKSSTPTVDRRNIAQSVVCLFIRLLNFAKFFAQSQRKSLELKICILTARNFVLVDV